MPHDSAQMHTAPIPDAPRRAVFVTHYQPKLFRMHLAKLFQRLGVVICLLFFAGFASAQISGTVLDSESGEPLIGASVVIKGTSSGAVTNIDGKFNVPAKAGDVLVISYTGFTAQTITVGAERDIIVNLEAGARLSEVVVTGYSTQSRRDITGSVAVIDTKDMTKIAASNFVEQLQGKVAGVQMSTSGDPGSAAFVRVRGYGTINNNEPLYVVDGVPVQSEANMNFLNPNDIEQMSVLKDASAASIYGTRAANGVVLITTKKGKLGKAKVSLDVFTGTQSPAKLPELLDPQGLLQLNQGLAQGAGQAFSSNLYVNNNGTWVLPDYIVRGGGFTGGVLEGNPAADPSRYFLTSDPLAEQGVNYLIQKANKAGTDWFDEMLNPSPKTSYNLSVSGGTESGNYFISANYFDHDGILEYNNFKRYQVRANTNYKIKNIFRVGQQLNVAYQTRLGSIGNPGEGSSIMNSYRMPQIVPMQDLGGYYGGGYGTGSNAGNPFAQQERQKDNFGHNIRTTGNVYAELDLFKFFTLKSSMGVDFNNGRGKNYSYRNFEATEVNSANGLTENEFTNTNLVWYNTLKFAKNLTDNVKFEALVGTEARSNHYIGFSGSGNKLAFGDNLSYRVLNNVDGKTMRVSGYEGKTTSVSQFVNANIDIMGKYLFTGIVRRDGSSKFINNRYGVFPGASFGWRISNEDFLKNSSMINDLKLRVGYGSTGNDAASGDFPGFSSYNTSIGESSYDITGSGNSVVPGFHQTSTGNPDLKWETTTMLDLGFDLTLGKHVDLVFDWFDRRTEDLIFGVPLPLTTGSAGVLNQNIGSMKNTGIELQLNYRGEALNRELTYNAGITFSNYKNEVLTLDANANTFIRSGGTRVGDATYTTAGGALSQFYGFIVDGLWSSQDEINNVLFENAGDAKPGRFKFRDINGDGQITALDETIIGSPHPDFIYGLNLNASYKGFDVTLYFQGVQGNDIFNYVKYFTHTPAFQANYSREMLDEAGKSLPVLDANDNYSNQRNSFYVEDGSYFRARNMQLGYTLPNKVMSKIGFDRLRIYLQGENLFTATNYSGLDPDITVDNIQEAYVTGRDFSLGMDRGRYPAPRSIIFGINAEF